MTHAQNAVTFLESSSLPEPKLIFINDTAATFTWELNWDKSNWGAAYKFHIEFAYGPSSEDYFPFDEVAATLTPYSFNRTMLLSYTAAGLKQRTVYRFRVIPIFKQGIGTASPPLILVTLDASKNYWEPIRPRRYTMASTARGFTNPVTQIPHLTPGVEQYGERVSSNPIRFSDAPTSETPVFPSSRRGHTLTNVDQLVYMFGGRSDGYTCAGIYKDLIDLGTIESGHDIYPCLTYAAEVQETWTLNVHTYEWIFINTTVWSSKPPPSREQHSAVVLDGDLYIFGGRTRVFPRFSNGSFIKTVHADVVFNDLWKLDIERPVSQSLKWTPTSPPIVPQDKRMYIPIDGTGGVKNYDSVTPRSGQCIDSVNVGVKISHSCANQLRISLMGPGPQTASANFHTPSSSHEVILYDRRKSNGTGCISGTHDMIFDDSASKSTEGINTQLYGTYKPDGLLREYVGGTTYAEWTLVVEDMSSDSIAGSVLAWNLSFITSPCTRKYIWTNVSASIPGSSAKIPARSQAKSLSYGTSIFIFGGRDKNDKPLTDLYRFDLSTTSWIKLTPVDFQIALETANSVGSNLMLTAWGVIRYGGYYRLPNYPMQYKHYVSDAFLLDPVTLRWKVIEVAAWPEPDSNFGDSIPSERYLSGAVFLSSSIIQFKRDFGYRSLYDNYTRSTHANYINSLADSILIMGGVNGATGSFIDGSSGGTLNDLFMLRLTNFSTDGNRYKQNVYRESNCKWRSSSSAVSTTASCLSTTSLTNCNFRDMIMLAWCASNNQTIR